MIVKGPEEIEFFTRFEPAKKGPPIYFLDKGDALAFLRRLSMNSLNRTIFRSLLSKVEGAVRAGRLSDEEVLDSMAEHLVSGRIWAVRVRLLKRSRSGRPRQEYMTPLEVSRMEGESRPPPPPKEKEAEAEAPPPRRSKPEISPEVAAAQAETLKAASESGAPFCEQ